MDVDLSKKSFEIINHEISEVEEYYEAIVTVANNFINKVNEILLRDVTDDFIPIISINDGILTVNTI